VWDPLARPCHLLLPWTANLAGNRPSSPLTPPSIPFTALPVSSPSHDYKSPTPPLYFPSFPRARDAARPANLLAGVRHCCGLKPQNPVSTDHAAPPLPHRNSSPSSELTLIFSLGPNEQQNELDDAHPKTISAPVTSPRECRKKSTTPSPPSDFPRQAEPRPHLRHHQNPRHRRQHPPPVRKLAAGDARKPWVSFSPLRFVSSVRSRSSGSDRST
jgi:hypothetical protein